MKKKNNFKPLAIIVALFIYANFNGNAHAQTLITPTNSPLSLITGYSTGIVGLNTAMIQGSSTSSNPVQEIIAMVYFDGSASALHLHDVLSNTTSSAMSLSSTPTSTPDVVLCNWAHGGPGATVDDYAVAVAYTDGNHVVVDIFVFFLDNTTFTYSTSPTQTIIYSQPGESYGTVHIDGLVHYGGTITTGYPYTKYVTVVWDEISGPSGIWAASFPVNAASFASTINISGSGYSPDVAEVERTVGGIQHWVALIAYTDAATNAANLYYDEWDITANTTTGASTDGTASGSDYLQYPRIDAIDDYNINPTGSGNAYYKTVAEFYRNATSKTEIRTYDNLLGVGGFTSSNVINYGPSNTPPYDHFLPTVALAASTPDYMVAHFTKDNALGGSNDIVMMEPIDYTVSTSIKNPPNRYYWVSQNPASSSNSFYASCASSNCNNISGSGLIAWAMYDGSSAYDIWYKITTYPYGFKPDPGTNKIVNNEEVLQLFPNPANNYITVSTGNASSYCLTDMVGRIVLQGSLPKGGNTIDIAKLVAGNYILKINESNGNCFTKMIVKE